VDTSVLWLDTDEEVTAPVSSNDVYYIAVVTESAYPGSPDPNTLYIVIPD
jgi:hypothetical protein